MKKIISAMLSLAIIIGTVAAFGMTTAAATTVYTADIDSQSGKGNGGTSNVVYDSEVAISGMAVKLKARTNEGDAYLSGNTCFGTKLIPLSGTATAGTYKLSVWLNTSEAIQNSSYSLWVTFHTSTAKNNEIKQNLHKESMRVCVADKKAGNDDYVGDTLYKTSKTGKLKNWKLYETEIYLPSDVTQIAVWANYGAGYTNSSEWYYYVDDISLTKVNGGAGIVNETAGDVGYNNCIDASADVTRTNGTSFSLVNDKTGDVYNLASNGLGNVHRTKLKSLTSSLTAGTYRVSVWMFVNGTEGIDFQFLLTFHSSTVTDATLGLDLTKNGNGIVKAYDTNDEHYMYYGNGGDAFEQSYRNGSKAVLEKTGRTENCGDGKKWVEYAGIVTLGADTSQYSLWFYRPANYDGAVTTTNAQPYYIDDLLVTEYQPSTTGVKIYAKNGTTVLETLTSETFETKYQSKLENLTAEVNNVESFKIWALKTPSDNVIGQAITSLFNGTKPVDALWDETKKEYAIYTEYKGDDALATYISYGDSADDGVIDNIYFNAVAFNDGKLQHTLSGYTSESETYYYNTYNMGILFGENDGTSDYTTDTALKFSADGGSPLFAKANVTDNKFAGKEDKDKNLGIGWYSVLLQSADGTGCYMESGTPIELTASDFISGTSEQGNENAKLMAIRWKNLDAFDKIGARMFYVTATGYTVYCPITVVTLAEGTTSLALN